MVFSEPVFLFLFLPIALAAISVAIAVGRGHRVSIFLFSLVFYYWSSGLFVLMLLGCVIANWAIAQVLQRDHRRRWLLLGLAANLGTLAYFKYAYFLTSNWDLVVGFADDATGQRAFIWDAVNGMRDLQVLLEAELGSDLTGWTLTEASGMTVCGSWASATRQVEIREGSFLRSVVSTVRAALFGSKDV